MQTDDTSDWPEGIGDYTKAEDWFFENPHDHAGPLDDGCECDDCQQLDNEEFD